MIAQKTIQEVDQDADLLQAQAEAALSLEHAQSFGIKLPDVVLNLAEWLTIKHYAQQYNVSTQVVSQWISRGVIPPHCTVTVPQLNDIRLVKNRPYRQP